jgi:hypothetical protein
MLANDMADRTAIPRMAKLAVALITIFGLLFMHGVTPVAAAAVPHCQEAPAHHHGTPPAKHHSTAGESEASTPTADHDACIGNHSQHPCAGTVRKAVHITVDSTPIAYNYDSENTRGLTGTTGLTYGGPSPPPPDLHALCISRT